MCAVAGDVAGVDRVQRVFFLGVIQRDAERAPAGDREVVSVARVLFGVELGEHGPLLEQTVHRGGQGIWNMEMSERNGQIVATFPVKADQDIIDWGCPNDLVAWPVSKPPSVAESFPTRQSALHLNG